LPSIASHLLRYAGTILCAGVAFVATAAHAQTPRTPVFVELFTSEGCSSCPPADTLLARLLKIQPVKDADIIVLEEHVDYWDSLGWHDRFSSPFFTARQQDYARRFNLSGPYTPQMVVDGTAEFVGNDSAHAMRAIAQASRAAKIPLTLSPVAVQDGHIHGSVTALLQGDGKMVPFDIYAVVLDAADSTSVLRGENGGRTLQHVSVVRSMQKIGTAASLTAGPLTFSLPAPKASGEMRVVVFAQRAGQGAVVGAAMGQVSAAPLSALAAR
jgi:hypothetical protein